MEKLSVVFSKVSFIGKDLFDGVFDMTTGCDTEGEIWAVMEGSGSYLRGKDKPVSGIDGAACSL